jgi:2-polyprenyl-6-methoxyphenol hydroxylase-like FAD-dependent oxidoreductase
LDINTQYISVGPESFFAYSIVDNIKQKNYSLLWYCYLHEKNRISRKKLTDYPDENITKRVSFLHKCWHHPIPKLINDSQKIIKTNIYDIIGIEKWSRDRVLLIGDSSHAMNPISGQGASFAMEDAQLLAVLIKKDNQNMIRNFKTLEKIRTSRITPIAKKARRSTRFSTMKVNPMFQFIRNKLFGLKLRIVPAKMYNRVFTYDVNNVIIK